jgi:transposase
MASDWLARYSKEGIEGLKNRPKSGRPPKLQQEIVLKIKRKLIESKYLELKNRTDGDVKERILLVSCVISDGKEVATVCKEMHTSKA